MYSCQHNANVSPMLSILYDLSFEEHGKQTTEPAWLPPSLSPVGLLQQQGKARLTHFVELLLEVSHLGRLKRPRHHSQSHALLW